MSPNEPRFERLRTLGRGSSGRVDLARLTAPFGDLPAGTEVAVKTLAPELREDPRARAALRGELETARAAEGPALLRVHHHGEGPEGPYLLEQYVPGRSLRELEAAEGSLPEPLVRSIGRRLADALRSLHAAGFAHGDLKPENVRLDQEGHAVLLDLGFAQRLHAPDGTPAAGEAGTLAYLSPERVQGGPPSPAADVHALGVLLYELVTGIHPFGYVPEGGHGPEAGEGIRPRATVGVDSSTGELLRRSIDVPGADRILANATRGRFTAPSDLAPELSPFLEAVIEDCLARRPEKRPEAATLFERLREGESSPWWRRRVDRAPEARLAPSQREEFHLFPLLGREAELHRLFDVLEEIRAEPRGHVLWLGGPAGSGKWRLVKEFARRARESDHPPLYLYARFRDETEGRPAGSLLLLLMRWLRLPLGTPPGRREERLLEGLVPPADARNLLRAVDPTATELERQIPAALARWLSALGRRGPIVCFLDDVHRFGPESLGALSVLVDFLEKTSILLVLGVREDVEPAEPELLDRLAQRLEHGDRTPHAARFERMELRPLDQETVLELTRHTFEPSVPHLRLARVLWKRSRGNPGQLVEILHDLIERGDAFRRTGETRLALAISPDELPEPRSLEAIIGERLAGLDAEERDWIQRLSTLGGRIEPDFVALAFGSEEAGRAELDELFARLVHRGWLVSRGDHYRFDRPALREAAYASLEPARRRELHRAAARGLEALPHPLSDENAFQHAFHLRAAGESEALLEAVLVRIKSLARRASSQRLATLAHWGLDALTRLPLTPERADARLELIEAAVDAADRLGQRDEERHLLDRLTDLESRPGASPQEGARLYLLHGRYAVGTGRFGLARGLLRNAAELARAAGTTSLLSESLRRLGQVQAHIGEFEEARSLGEEALALATEVQEVALAELALAHLHVLEDGWEEALERIDRAQELLRRGHEFRPGIVGYAQVLTTRVWRSAGRPMRALRAARRAVRVARRSGERRLEAEARARLGGILLDLDRPREAEEELRDAQLLAEEIEDRRGETLARVSLGLLLWEADSAEARAEVERATELAHEIGFHRAEAVGLAFDSRIVLFEGRDALADELSTRAMALLERHGAELVDRITIAANRAFVLRARGKRSAARTVERELRRRIRHANGRLRDAELRRDQLDYSRRLLEAVLSREGPVNPRTPGVGSRG